jgi:cell division transport system permease protein
MRKLRQWFTQHGQASISSLGQITRAPFANILTVLVIGIALALPLSLLVLVKNLQQVSSHWDHGTGVSVFLAQDLSSSQIDQVLSQLRVMPGVADLHYISPNEGWQTFREQTGMQDVLSELPNNPLPAVVEIQPAIALQSPAAINQLLNELRVIPGVEVAQMDVAWVKRLYALLDLGTRIIYALGLLLAAAVALVVGNTIRLIIQNHSQEIKVIKLVGGTNRFIRRPFLYMGIFYGLFGAVMALILVNVFIALLQSPVDHLVRLYNSFFQLQGLQFAEVESVLLIGTMLGLLGAWLAVGRQLSKIEPD